MWPVPWTGRAVAPETHPFVFAVTASVLNLYPKQYNTQYNLTLPQLYGITRSSPVKFFLQFHSDKCMVILLVITYALYYMYKRPEEIFNLLFPAARTTRLKRIVRSTEHCTEDMGEFTLKCIRLMVLSYNIYDGLYFIGTG